ncbi:hypothetical protein [Taibaiella soli]|uniref:Anti-sigma factor n=1 Tax=Taibaiella soli TaxID=1649169 RepID=A0A2W2B3N0_9BACT|nr:hypothetical protein [Taibaiella soli]PZF70839.1 hypothetical protein DN068_21600 [Taibaiella soli]
MNIQEYIDSGVIEAYVLGLLEEREEQELRRLLGTQPLLQEALWSVEDRLERMAYDNRVPPPLTVWAEIESRLFETTPKIIPTSRKPEEEVKVIFSDGHIRVHKYWRPAFIGIFILSKILLILAIFYYLSYRKNQQQIEFLQQQVQSMQHANNAK